MPSKQTSPRPTQPGPAQGGQPMVAVPRYVPGDFSSAPPGHRYLLYLPFWKQEWSAIKEDKQKALKELITLPPDSQKLMRALAERQLKTGQTLGAKIVSAVSISPFATGLGWEHPNENGFAFLHPYGLPYLAGSGVKGVVRRAAEEMALFGSDDSIPEDGRWTMLDVWWLFGFEGASGAVWETEGEWATAFARQMATVLERPDLPKFLKHLKIPNDGTAEKLLWNLNKSRRDLQLSGAIRFWDVIPELAENKKMGVDIMNPHYGDYYQRNSTPNDSGNPVPIFFLVVPPESKFTFVVDCPRERHLPEVVRGRWRKLLDAAFEHAFTWLGFGAKTAVGYGAMQPKNSPSAETTSQQGQQPVKSPLTPEEQAIEKLRVLFEEHKKYGGPPGGQFANSRIELLRQAKNWEAAETCQHALDLIEETLIMYPWAGKKEKVAAREKEMEALRHRIQELRSRKAP